MFKRSRNKIILSIMLSLILMLVLTLSVILLVNYHEIRQRDARMLRQYAEQYDQEQAGGGNTPAPAPFEQENPARVPDPGAPPPDEAPDYRLSTFYSVAFAEDGTVLSADCDLKGLYSEEELIGIARELLDKGKTSGKRGNLSFLIRDKAGYTLVAFIDSTVKTAGIRTLIRDVLIIGGTAIMIMFFVALFLAKRIIRPLEENDRQQKQFISDAGHELKTPVAVISANAELLSRELPGNEWLSNIQYENERMGDLVKRLLDLSRAENRETPMETVDFSRTVTGEVLAFESVAFERGKILQSDMEEGISVLGNQSQLAQLVSVLLDNAVRHSTGQEIDLSLKRRGHEAVLSVTNEGAEILPEQQAHLFDRFYRVDEARNSEGHHYGLGLSIAKAVCEKHGGSIGVSWRDGKTCFTVTLPAKK